MRALWTAALAVLFCLSALVSATRIGIQDGIQGEAWARASGPSHSVAPVPLPLQEAPREAAGSHAVHTLGARQAAHIVDSIVEAAMADGRAAGMSVAVARQGRILVDRTYGHADLELDVPTPPDAVYEIGSVTKQFTATALLQLWERGKVNLDADLTTYLPDYPTQGHRVPVRRLLDHTSGIRGYTELPAFGEISIRHVPRDTLIALFASEPFDFEPGEAAIYNNSAYYLLGLIIEEVSGMSYEEYVEEHLFRPAGMVHSSYCSETRITPRKVKGYQANPEGLGHKGFLVHDHPYAAGSLCSTTRDLIRWTEALHDGRILGDEAYRIMTTGGTLNDGTRLRYAGGLSLSPIRGHEAVHHGGGINGFLSNLAWIPDEDLTVAVLVNTLGPVGPGGITADIVEALLGEIPLETHTFTGDPSRYEGSYAGVGRGQSLRASVTVGDDGGLMVRLGQSSPQPLQYLGGETFALGNSRFTFEWEGTRLARVRADMGANYTFLHPD